MLKIKIVGASLLFGVFVFGLYTNCGELGPVNHGNNNSYSEEDFINAANKSEKDDESDAVHSLTRPYNHPMNRGESVYGYPNRRRVDELFPKLKYDSKFNAEWEQLITVLEAPMRNKISRTALLMRDLSNHKINFYIRWGIASKMFQVTDPIAHQKYWNRLWHFAHINNKNPGELYEVPSSVFAWYSAPDLNLNAKDLFQKAAFGSAAHAKDTPTNKNPDTGIVRCRTSNPIPIPKCHPSDAEQVFSARENCSLDSDGDPDLRKNARKAFTDEVSQDKDFLPNLGKIISPQREPKDGESEAERARLDLEFKAYWGDSVHRFDDPNSVCIFDKKLARRVRNPTFKIYLSQRFEQNHCPVPLSLSPHAGVELTSYSSHYNADGRINSEPRFGSPSFMIIERNECKSFSQQELEAQYEIIRYCEDGASNENCNDVFANRVDLSEYKDRAIIGK